MPLSTPILGVSNGAMLETATAELSVYYVRQSQPSRPIIGVPHSSGLIEVKRSFYSPLSGAAWNGNEAVVKLLLDKGADVKSKSSIGKTPLSRAAEKGHEAVVKLLLEKGVDVESKDGFGRTPLSRAAEKGHEAVVKLLLEKGVDVESKDGFGRTPLSWAAEKGHEAVVKLLLEKGAQRGI